MGVRFFVNYLILFISYYAAVVLLEYNSFCVDVFHLSSGRVIFCQESLVTVPGTCQQLPGASVLHVCEMSVSHAVQRMLVPVLLIHLEMRLLMPSC